MPQAGREVAFGVELAAVGRCGELPLEEFVFDVLGGGDVLEEAVDLDRVALGVTLGLRDDS